MPMSVAHHALAIALVLCCRADRHSINSLGLGNAMDICHGMYMEEQENAKCGVHAINAVLFNAAVGHLLTPENLTQLSIDVGMESRDGNWLDLGVIYQAMLREFGDGNVAQVATGTGKRTVHDLLSEVGKVENDNYTRALSPSKQEALKKQARTVNIDTMQWVICNSGNHWQTFFTVEGGFCDLNSLNSGPKYVSSNAVKNFKCDGIVVPVEKPPAVRRVSTEKHGQEARQSTVVDGGEHTHKLVTNASGSSSGVYPSGDLFQDISSESEYISEDQRELIRKDLSSSDEEDYSESGVHLRRPA